MASVHNSKCEYSLLPSYFQQRWLQDLISWGYKSCHPPQNNGVPLTGADLDFTGILTHREIYNLCWTGRYMCSNVFSFPVSRLQSWKCCPACLVSLEENAESGPEVIIAESVKTPLVELLVLWEIFLSYWSRQLLNGENIKWEWVGEKRGCPESISADPVGPAGLLNAIHFSFFIWGFLHCWPHTGQLYPLGYGRAPSPPTLSYIHLQTGKCLNPSSSATWLHGPATMPTPAWLV